MRLSWLQRLFEEGKSRGSKDSGKRSPEGVVWRGYPSSTEHTLVWSGYRSSTEHTLVWSGYKSHRD